MIVKIESSNKYESTQIFYISYKNYKEFIKMYLDELKVMQENKLIFCLEVDKEDCIATWYESEEKKSNYKVSAAAVSTDFDVFWHFYNEDFINKMLKKFPELSEDREFETNI